MPEHPVTFGSGEQTLADNLTVPPGAGPLPDVLLLPGSGQLDRNLALAVWRSKRLISDAVTPNTESFHMIGSPSGTMCVTKVREPWWLTLKCRWDARRRLNPRASRIR